MIDNKAKTQTGQEPEKKVKQRTPFQTFFAFALIMLAMSMPEQANAAAWDNMADSILGFFNNGLTRTIGIIVIIGLGLAAWAGKLTWGLAGKVIMGFVLVFGATGIADLFIGSV